jgi:hypothetical protein
MPKGVTDFPKDFMGRLVKVFRKEERDGLAQSVW